MADDRISPTAAYTGQTWVEHGLSPREFGSTLGRWMLRLSAPTQFVAERIGAPTLQAMLLARHAAIDSVLTKAIERGEVHAVIELACGRSGRGLRFSQRFAAVLYVETDLPAMAERKTQLLAAQSKGSNHTVRALNAFSPEGLATLADELREQIRSQQPSIANPGIAIVAEGLHNYFPEAAVRDLWQRSLAVIGSGLFVGDLHVRSGNDDSLTKLYERALGAFVRGRVFIHFDNAADVEAVIADLGGAASVVTPDQIVQVPDVASAQRVHIVVFHSA